MVLDGYRGSKRFCNASLEGQIIVKVKIRRNVKILFSLSAAKEKFRNLSYHEFAGKRSAHQLSNLKRDASR